MWVWGAHINLNCTGQEFLVVHQHVAIIFIVPGFATRVVLALYLVICQIGVESKVHQIGGTPVMF